MRDPADHGTELLPELAGSGTALRLHAPRWLSAGGDPAGNALSPERDGGLRYRGEPESEAAGVTVRAEISRCESGVDLDFHVASRTVRHGAQCILPLELGLSWTSYVVAPGAIYSGNRFLVSPQPYCPYLPTEGVSPDGPILIADVPRLTSDRGYEAVLAANALAVPAIGALDPGRKLAFIVGMDVYGPWGVTGVALRTLPGKPIAVEIRLPVMRSRRYRFCDWVDVTEPGMDLEPDRPMRFTARILAVQSDSIPKLISDMAAFRHSCRGREERRRAASFGEAAHLIEGKLDAHNWSEADGYYRSGIGAGPWRLQTGWVGGGVTFHAMARSSDGGRRRRAIRMMDTICRNGLSASGYFHGMHDGNHWLSFGVKRPGCRAFSLIRRPLECTRDVLKTLECLRARAEALDPAWERAARRNLDAMVGTVARFGHLGYTVDFETGDVLWGDSACGAFGMEPLVRGAAWFGEPAYLKTAGRLAEVYGTKFLSRGFTCGGVGDSLMAPDSESCYALLSGMIHLHAATKDPRYLEWAIQAADLLSTWVLSYDARLPPDSPLGRLGVRPRGAVFANVQNQHGTPGICTSSGDALLALYNATGEERHLRLLEDIAQCIPQMIVRPGQEDTWGSLPVGSISERLMTMDGMEPCGHTARISTWSEIAMLLTARELPSAFRDPVRGLTAVFES